jgi:hypothetical protein
LAFCNWTYCHWAYFYITNCHFALYHLTYCHLKLSFGKKQLHLHSWWNVIRRKVILALYHSSQNQFPKSIKEVKLNEPAGKPNRTGRQRLSTVDLLVLTSLVQLLFKLTALFTFFTKPATLMRRSIVLSLPLQLAFPGTSHRQLQPTTTYLIKLFCLKWCSVVIS